MPAPRRGQSIARLALLYAALEAAQVSLADLLITKDREQQGHVDVHAICRQLLERPHPRLGARHLDQDVRTADLIATPAGGVDRALDVVGEVRRELERDVAVPTLCTLEGRSQQIAGVASVGEGDAEIDLAWIAGLGDRLPQVPVVALRVLHRLLEYRRIRGDPGHAV